VATAQRHDPQAPPQGKDLPGPLSCDDHQLRRERLIAAHGQPAPADTGTALRLLGLRGQVHPLDAAAFIYRDQAAAAAWAEEDAEHYGVPRLGTAPVDGGVLSVLDLRPAIAAHAQRAGRPWRPTDPGRPDRG
jgi:hypothetical protein